MLLALSGLAAQLQLQWQWQWPETHGKPQAVEWSACAQPRALKVDDENIVRPWPLPTGADHGTVNVSLAYWARQLNASAVTLETQPSPNWLFGAARDFTELCYWTYRFTGELWALEKLILFNERTIAQFCPKCPDGQGPPQGTTAFYNLSQMVGLASAAHAIYETEWPSVESRPAGWNRSVSEYKALGSRYAAAANAFLGSFGKQPSNTCVVPTSSSYIADCGFNSEFGPNTLPLYPFNQISCTLPTFIRLAAAIQKGAPGVQHLATYQNVGAAFVKTWMNSTVQETINGKPVVEWSYLSQDTGPRGPGSANIWKAKAAHDGAFIKYPEDTAHGGADVQGLFLLLETPSLLLEPADHAYMLSQMDAVKNMAMQVLQCRGIDGKPNGTFHFHTGVSCRPLHGPTVATNVSRDHGHDCTALASWWKTLALFDDSDDEQVFQALEPYFWRGGGGRDGVQDLSALVVTLMHNKGLTGTNAHVPGEIKPVA